MPQPIVAVIGASQSLPESPEYQDGLRLGRLLAAAGYTVVTGGYGGLMEAVSAGAAEVGGPIIGVTAPAVFPGRSAANRHVTDERPAPTITERIHELLHLADAVIALPGSLGTLTELVAAWNLAYVAPFSGRQPKPIVAVGPVWTELVPQLTRTLETDGSLVQCVDSVDGAIQMLTSSLEPAGPGA